MVFEIALTVGRMFFVVFVRTDHGIEIMPMSPDNRSNREETILELFMTMSALVLAIARHAVEQRGGAVKTDPLAFELTCTGISPSEQNACSEEIDRLFTLLQHTTVFDLNALELNVSLS